MVRVAVMGAGSWGTAFAMMCRDAGGEVELWARGEATVDEVNGRHTNAAYLPGVELPADLHATSDAQQALGGADVVVLAVPSIGVTAQLAAWGASIPGDATLVSLVKGVESGTLRFGSEVVRAALDCDPDRVVVVSGPNLARECAARLPAATVAASPDQARAAHVQATVMTPYFRVYTNPDKIGVEVGGAVKNVIALAAGIARGMGFGDNTLAAVITRGLAEMTRLGVAMGGQPLTFSGLAGVGDLVATCTSSKSRNNQVGEKLGRGEDLDAVVGGMSMIAEGVKSSRAILELSRRHGVDMPITAGVVRVVHDSLDPQAMVKELMGREAKSELYGLDP